jgi:hypothetical protein
MSVVEQSLLEQQQHSAAAAERHNLLDVIRDDPC